MKKITLLALLMAGALCASAATPISKNVTTFTKGTKGEVVARVAAPGTVSTPYQYVPTRDEVPEGYASVTLAAGDVWEDGSGYQMLLDADATAYGTIIPETGGLTTSGDASAETYAEFEYKIPENADGSLTTQNIIMNGQATILIPAGVYDYCITNPTPGDRLWIASDNGGFPGRGDDYEFKSQASYIITISLHGQNDGAEIEIDDPFAMSAPSELAVEPGSTDAVVSWTPGNFNETTNLRYREWTDPASMAHLWDLPYEGYEAQLDEGWMVYDADGDGNGWGLAYSDNSQTDLCFTSASYSGGALSPDNWLFTPTVGLGGTLNFKAWQQSTTYPDKIKVYLCTNPEWETVDEFVELTEEFIQPAGTTAEEFTIDLSAYEGEGVIAFRHFDCTDQWAIYLDDIEVIPANPAVPAEWIEIEDVANPFTIDELTPETTYEVQVQGARPLRAEGDELTAWTESVIFTTLPAGQEDAVYYVVGGFNGWAEEEGIEIGEEGATIIVEAQGENDTNQEFKLITPDVADGEGWIWLGGADENGVNYFAITEELLGGEISLETPGANFRLPEAGTYNIKLVTVPIKAQVDGIKMIVTKEDITAIDTVKSEVKGDNNYYNLMGQKMNGNNLPAGIYIHNGKKVVVK